MLNKPINADILAAAQLQNKADFLRKYEQLCQYWASADVTRNKSEIGREFNALLLQCHQHPAIIALIADDLHSYQQHSAKSDYKHHLLSACMLGSQTIGEWLMQQNNIDLSQLDENIRTEYFARIALSGNADWLNVFWNEARLNAIPAGADCYQMHAFDAIEDMLDADIGNSPTFKH